MLCSSTHLSAASFPVDHSGRVALVEENPASRSEIRAGVLLRLGDDPALRAALEEAPFRELQASEFQTTVGIQIRFGCYVCKHLTS